LLQAHGEDVLRVKGLLDVRGMTGPVAIHGVQHVVHPPVHLKRWPGDDRRSLIVFIVRGLEQEAIEASLAAFNALANNHSAAV
jgi:G3E family GTPase